MVTYGAIRRDLKGVITRLRSYSHQEEFYYRLRKPAPRSDRTRAARFLYLNRACCNGLYRLNQKGRFDTPFGRFKNPTICGVDRLEKASRMLQRAKLRTGDFEEIVEEARPGDFVYFDPPYITGHAPYCFNSTEILSLEE